MACTPYFVVPGTCTIYVQCSCRNGGQSLFVLISTSSSPPSTRHLAFYPCLTHSHHLPDSGDTAASHSKEPTVGCPLISFFGAGHNYRGAQASKASTPLANPVERARGQWHTIGFMKTGSALSASIVHASHCLMSTHTLTPSGRWPSLRQCERKRITQKEPPVPQPFPQCRLFKSNNHLPCRDMRMARTLMGHPPLKISLDGPLSKR